jgi:hypothetical protein
MNHASQPHKNFDIRAFEQKIQELSVAHGSFTDHVRRVFPIIEPAINNGVPLALILAALNEQLDAAAKIGAFKSALQRIRRENNARRILDKGSFPRPSENFFGGSSTFSHDRSAPLPPHSTVPQWAEPVNEQHGAGAFDQPFAHSGSTGPQFSPASTTGNYHATRNNRDDVSWPWAPNGEFMQVRRPPSF